jgi:hypothetical protein
LAPAFDFEISMHVMIDKLADLTVHIGDAELPIRADSAQGRMHRIAFWVPAALVEPNGLTALRFQTREVFQAPTGDIRLLSFLVRALSVSRVEPAGTAPPVLVPSGDAPRRRPAAGSRRRRASRR